jgi:hypothetical protein
MTQKKEENKKYNTPEEFIKYLNEKLNSEKEKLKENLIKENLKRQN